MKNVEKQVVGDSASVTINYSKKVGIKSILETIATAIIALVFLDGLILAVSLLQVGIEGNTGAWPDFWYMQAQWLAKIL